MKLFNRDKDSSCARKRWHSKARMINLEKTKIVIITSARPKQDVVQPSIYGEIPLVQDTYAVDRVGIQDGYSVGCPVSNVTDTSSVRADNWSEFLLSKM